MAALAFPVAAHAAPGPDVAIDVGHYRQEPGAISAGGVSEFELNRQLALSLAEALRSGGAGVRVIGADGEHASLTARVVEAAGARLLVSIHHDSVRRRFLPARDPRFAGFSLWVSRRNRHSDASIACAALLADRLTAAGFTPSHYHADPVIGEGRPVIDDGRGIFARDALAVLSAARSPAVLVEAGVIVNPVEEARLRQPEVFRAEVAALAAGVQACLGMTAPSAGAGVTGQPPP